MALIDDCVTEADNGTFTFECPTVWGSPCGNPATGRGFVSSGWADQYHAKARGEEHLAEHKGEPMPSLEEFRVRIGISSVQDEAPQDALRMEALP